MDSALRLASCNLRRAMAWLQHFGLVASRLWVRPGVISSLSAQSSAALGACWMARFGISMQTSRGARSRCVLRHASALTAALPRYCCAAPAALRAALQAGLWRGQSAIWCSLEQ